MVVCLFARATGGGVRSFASRTPRCPLCLCLMFTVRPSNRRCVVWHMAPYALVALKKPMHECKNSFC